MPSIIKHKYRLGIDSDVEQLELNEKGERPFAPYASTVFHAHQYLEKTLKDAYYLVSGESLEGHDLDDLFIDLATMSGKLGDDEYDDMLEICQRLSRQYIPARYPDKRTGMETEYTEDQARDFVADARRVVKWIGIIEIRKDVRYVDSFTIRHGIRRRAQRIADTPGYRRIVSEYSKILRVRCGRRACAF